MLSPSHSTRASSRLVSLLCFGLLLLDLAALAAEPEGTAGSPKPAAAAPVAGMRIYVDPLTGELTSRPTPEQAQQLSAAIGALFTRPVDEPVVFQLSTGGTGVRVGNRFESVTVVRVRPDGTFDFECADPEHAPEVLAAPAAPPTASTAYAPR